MTTPADPADIRPTEYGLWLALATDVTNLPNGTDPLGPAYVLVGAVDHDQTRRDAAGGERFALYVRWLGDPDLAHYGFEPCVAVAQPTNNSVRWVVPDATRGGGDTYLANPSTIVDVAGLAVYGTTMLAYTNTPA